MMDELRSQIRLVRPSSRDEQKQKATKTPRTEEQKVRGPGIPEQTLQGRLTSRIGARSGEQFQSR